MKYFLLTICLIFIVLNITVAQTALRMGLTAGQQRVNIESNNGYGKVSSQSSTFSEIYLNSSLYLGRHSLIFGVGQRIQNTAIDYVTKSSNGSLLGDIVIVIFGGSPSSSVTPIYHAAERIELDNKYLTIPVGIEFVLNKSAKGSYLYLTPLININVIIKNKRRFHITTNYDFQEAAEAAAESFSNIPFRPFVNFTIEFGGKIQLNNQIGFGGGLKYQSGNSNMYGKYGGVKSTVAPMIFLQYNLTSATTSNLKVGQL